MNLQDKKNSCPTLSSEFDFFQDLMLSMIARRVAFQRFKKHLEERGVDADNDVFRLCRYGYVIAQLSDCRKFFDRDGRVHVFSFVVQHSRLGAKHDNLFKKWKKDNFEGLANDYLLHANKKSKDLSISMEVFDDFINELKGYIEEIFEDLLRQGFVVSLLVDLMSSDSKVFLKERENEVDGFFETICQGTHKES